AQPQGLLQAALRRSARPRAGDPVPALADDPLLRRLQREDGRQASEHRRQGGHRPRQPRGRGGRGPQGGGTCRAREGRQGARSRRDAAVEPRQRARLPVDPRRPDDAGHRDRGQARRHHGPEGGGAVGHPLRRPVAGPARGQGERPEADPRPRAPRDGPGRGARRRDRGGVAAHAGNEHGPRGPGGLPAHEDHAGRRRPPGLRLDQRPDAQRGRVDLRRAAHHRPAGPVALLHRPHGRRVHDQRPAAVLRPVRRHQGRRGLRGPVPRRLPARLRRRLVAAPRADRHRQEGLLARPGRGEVRQEGHRRDPRRPRRPHDRRQDAGRRDLEAVPGHGSAGDDARGEGSGAQGGVRAL
ncbi:MAG: Malyl-CoA lyase @ Beta-methylmalyl-CoA lyase @ Citramalyl-CoA lyase, partial [uncultured Solirubrobacteraceae bacterium]